MAFDASTQVEPLDYDFTKFVPDAKGTIAEPTEQEVRKMERDLNKINRKYAGLTLEQMADHIEKMDEAEYNENREATMDAVMIVCKNNPSRDQIEELPFRIKQKFFGWIMRELLRPEQYAAGTNS